GFTDIDVPLMQRLHAFQEFFITAVLIQITADSLGKKFADDMHFVILTHNDDFDFRINFQNRINDFIDFCSCKNTTPYHKKIGSVLLYIIEERISIVNDVNSFEQVCL